MQGCSCFSTHVQGCSCFSTHVQGVFMFFSLHVILICPLTPTPPPSPEITGRYFTWMKTRYHTCILTVLISFSIFEVYHFKNTVNHSHEFTCHKYTHLCIDLQKLCFNVKCFCLSRLDKEQSSKIVTTNACLYFANPSEFSILTIDILELLKLLTVNLW